MEILKELEYRNYNNISDYFVNKYKYYFACYPKDINGKSLNEFFEESNIYFNGRNYSDAFSRLKRNDIFIEQKYYYKTIVELLFNSETFNILGLKDLGGGDCETFENIEYHEIDYQMYLDILEKRYIRCPNFIFNNELGLYFDDSRIVTTFLFFGCNLKDKLTLIQSNFSTYSISLNEVIK